MADRTFNNVRIKHKRDTSANWTTNNPTLLEGELIVVDTNESGIRLKVGTGDKTYTQLPFIDEALYNALSTKASKPTRGNVSITESGTSTIEIPIEVPSIDRLFVYHNGLLLAQDLQYTATTTHITLVGYTAHANDIFIFVVM